MTVIRDATRSNGVLYAVGSAVTRLICPGLPGPQTGPCQNNNTDTPILWRFDGSGATLEELPNLVINNTFSNFLTAHDITADAAYIAGQARSSATTNATQAVRVTTNIPLLGAAVNLNLAANPFPVLAPSTFASAISDDGTILYGISAGRVIRFDTAASTSGPIPLLSPSHTGNSLIPRGTSSDGSVVVGTSFNATELRPFRYTHGSGVVAQIPLLNGGTRAVPLAVSPDGDLILMIGDSASSPNAGAYLYRASTGATLSLGSPQDAWQPGGTLCANGFCNPPHPIGAGMTADGSVVAMNFRQPLPPGSPTGTPGGPSYAYFRNQYGWFHLTSALAANGLDIAADGWDHLLIMGMSSDGTLVYGAGEHNGIVEGFVADFASAEIALKDFNPPPVAPTDRSIVGAWIPSSDSDNALVFTADGVYYHITSVGFERGLYTFDGSAFSLTTLFDTNGSFGLSDGSGATFPLTITGNTGSFDNGGFVVQRVVGSAGSIVGGWVGGNPTQTHNSIALVATATEIFNAFDFSDGNDSGHGTYTWNPVTHELVFTPIGGGIPDSGNFVTLSADGLVAHVDGDDGESFDLARVIDPATIPVVANSPLATANGISGQVFSYSVTATNTTAFSAVGLPSGLIIDSVTGLISGTPNVGGQFVVTIKATNSEGVSDIETLVLTIAIPTPVGQDVVVEPEVPEGQGPITLTFEDIATAGTTEVTVIDLDESGIPPPGSVSVGGVVYEVTTTATFSGLITLCFSYAGIDFGDAEPRLFHFENGVWVDITTSVDPDTQTICGATTTLSPFAVLISNVVRKGFYAPINPIAGFLNTVRAGTTVPLKFEVFVNGVEQTTIAGLTMTQQQIECAANAPLDDVESAPVTGGTSLRYDETGGYFVQNWRVPNTPGRCYMIQMTTEQDALALTARFKVR